jgi:hypothetical protein
MLLHLPPIVNVDSRGLEGFEALVRWNHPTRGIVPPAEFIPLAEETGIILPLGRFVISEACRQLGHWQRTIPGAEGLSVSVNVSCRQFARDGLVEHVAQVLEETGLDPSRLKLEITESVLMRDTARSVHELTVSRPWACASPWTSSARAIRLFLPAPAAHRPPKIDRSFISGSDNVEDNVKIVTSIISLARNLGLRHRRGRGARGPVRPAAKRALRQGPGLHVLPARGRRRGRALHSRQPVPGGRGPPGPSVPFLILLPVRFAAAGGEKPRCNFLHDMCIFFSSIRQIVR